MSSEGHCPSLLRLARELEEPVARLGVSGWGASRLQVLLDRGEMRAWRIESAEQRGVLSGRCPVEGTQALLAVARSGDAEVPAGGFLVGRSLPVGPGRWVLVGRPVVVAGERTGAFERLLGSLRAPRGEFWRVHGGVIGRAARLRGTGGAAFGERRAA